MKPNYLLITAFALQLHSFPVNAQNYEVDKTGSVTSKKQTVLLLKEPLGKNNIILFQTTLRVNTDGTPLSYHPQDPRGKAQALNNVCNAIAVRKSMAKDNLCLTSYSEAIGVFEKWRDANYLTIPEGYEIKWENVLAGIKVNGKIIPCVFKTGANKGYFGSLTALKNELPDDKSECELNNQVNPMAVPALVLLGGNNALKEFGAGVGDLVVAYHPETRVIAAAIIGDTGPKDNLGEGSILLNMRLLKTTTLPTSRAETFKLSIENSKILIAILPASRSFQLEGSKPYTADNIEKRVRDWQKQAGFSTLEQLVEHLKKFQLKLN